MEADEIEIASRIEAAYEALAGDDVDLFLSAFAQDARWRLLGHNAGLPFTGNHTGHGAIRRMIASIFELFKMRDFFVEDIIVQGESVGVRWSAVATSKDTARQSAVEVFDHIIMRDGMIVSLTQFFDSAAVADVAGRMKRITQDN
jgi:ketosteroid isomerase-like protein